MPRSGFNMGISAKALLGYDDLAMILKDGRQGVSPATTPQPT